VLVIEGLRLAPRKIGRDELNRAFQLAEFGEIRMPGQKQEMDAHEVRGLFITYLTMAGATLAAPDSESFVVEESKRPYVEALQRAFRILAGDEAAFQIRLEP
jgi:hypothetical protein